MIAFFAWSNMLILNQVNIKINLYLEIEADLFVWGTNPIDYRLVEIIKKSKKKQKNYKKEQKRNIN